jgi:hypothetical protein
VQAEKEALENEVKQEMEQTGKSSTVNLTMKLFPAKIYDVRG